MMERRAHTEDGRAQCGRQDTDYDWKGKTSLLVTYLFSIVWILKLLQSPQVAPASGEETFKASKPIECVPYLNLNILLLTLEGHVHFRVLDAFSYLYCRAHKLSSQTPLWFCWPRLDIKWLCDFLGDMLVNMHLPRKPMKRKVTSLPKFSLVNQLV